MSSEETEKGSRFIPTDGDAGAERRLARLEELRHDLFHAPPAATINNQSGGKRNSAMPDDPKAAYALETLLAMLYND